MLINGRKFSLRLYVVYFGPEEVYLSHQGLVKLAAAEAMEDASNIFNTVKRVLNISKDKNITSTMASNSIAEERLQTIASLRKMHIHRSSVSI